MNGKMGDMVCSGLPDEGTCCSYETEFELEAGRGMKLRAWNILNVPNVTGSPGSRESVIRIPVSKCFC